MAIKNYMSNDFRSTFVDSVNVFYCRLSGVKKLILYYFFMQLGQESLNMIALCNVSSKTPVLLSD